MLNIGRFVCSAVMVASTATGAATQARASMPATDVQPNITQATERIDLGVGRSTVLTTDFEVVRFSVTDPAVADAAVVSPHQVLIDAKAAGSISLILWGERTIRHYEVNVGAPASDMQRRMSALFPGEDITVTIHDEMVILSGHASSDQVSIRAAEAAVAGAGKASVVNLIQLPGGIGSQQVMLQVRFAEVSRRAIFELGASFFTTPNGAGNWVGQATTQQFPSVGFDRRFGPPPASNPNDEGRWTFSDFLNVFLYNYKHGVAALIKALEDKGMFQSLAEPNLIAYNGKEASFLAGGEIPIPVVQGNSGAVGVEWKEFGIRLRFKPQVVGDVIRLTVMPEVSTLDWSNGLVLSGFRVPALSTRRAETEVELRDGQSFAIAGLLNNVTQDQVSAIPGLSKIPVLGKLFQSMAKRNDKTELLVLITPTLVRPLNPDELPPLPGEQKPSGEEKPSASPDAVSGSVEPDAGASAAGRAVPDAAAPTSLKLKGDGKQQ